MTGARGNPGALAIVLHTHMPYVEGFGTWPFGEEWLWEAMATCYLPLIGLLDDGAPLTLSVTPVLCDQLEVRGLGERFRSFVEGPRRESYERDAAGLRAGGQEALARELERAWGDYARALEGLEARGGELLGAFAGHAQWTSAATHAVLPLLATDAAVGVQVQTGVGAFRRRFGGSWRGGFWLPECAHAEWLEPALEEAGVGAVCVELTDRLGLGAVEHLRPLTTGSGVVLVPIDRQSVSLVWSEGGYPASGAYRDYHHHTVHHRNPWRNDGGIYDHGEAVALARGHAVDFVSRVRARLRGGGLVVFAVDTELLGHWWYEGLEWLRAVVEECSRQELRLMRLDDALETIEPGPPGAGALRARGECEGGWQATSWGHGGDLSTWSGPAVAEIAFAARAAELAVVAAGARVSRRAVRELLALQASDWAFMVSRDLAAPYGRERFDGHRRALERALGSSGRDSVEGPGNLAVHADLSALLAP